MKMCVTVPGIVGAAAWLVTIIAAPSVLACAPTAVVTGPDAVVLAVKERLIAEGIRSAQQEGCDSIAVVVRPHSQNGPYDVAIRDPYGRQSQRVVASIAVAAILIGSWARTDVDADLLQPLVVESERRAPRVTTSATIVSATGLGLAGESTLSTDGSLWAGVRMNGCVEWKRLCVGGTARVAADKGWTGQSAATPTKRLAVESLALVQMPFVLGKLTVMPGIAAGAGVTQGQSARRTGSAVEEEGDFQDNAASFWHVSPRFEASVGLFVNLASQLGLEFCITGSASPWAQSRVLTINEVKVAAEALASLRASIGVRWAFR